MSDFIDSLHEGLTNHFWRERAKRDQNELCRRIISVTGLYHPHYKSTVAQHAMVHKAIECKVRWLDRSYVKEGIPLMAVAYYPCIHCWQGPLEHAREQCLFRSTKYIPHRWYHFKGEKIQSSADSRYVSYELNFLIDVRPRDDT